MIIRIIMKKILNKIIELELKMNIIESTSLFELRLTQGTRHIMHFEAYIIKLFYIFNIYFTKTTIDNNNISTIDNNNISTNNN